MPSKNGAAVIAFPGRSGSQAHTRMLVRHGYGVLLFDRRGEGKSEGDSNLLGWGGDKDILAAVEFLKTRPDVDPGKIGGLGLSVGGELMLQAAAETDELAAVVSEGAGTRQLSEQLEEFHGFERVLNAPGFLFVTVGTAVFSSTAPPPNLTDVAPKIKQPLFVIWAPNGGNIEHMSRSTTSSRSGPKQIWAMPTAKHVGGIRDQPQEYERRVVGFFDKTLLAGAEPKPEAPPSATERAGLQSFWSRRRDSNPRPTALQMQLLYQLSYSGTVPESYSPYCSTSRVFWWARILRLTRWSALSIVLQSQPRSSAISSYESPSR